jgi:hypothetical protein
MPRHSQQPHLRAFAASREPKYLADLLIHSRYSRAMSRDCTLEGLHHWAQRKGVTVVGTGDCTHPGWFAELAAKLVPAAPGLYQLRPAAAAAADQDLPDACRAPVRRPPILGLDPRNLLEILIEANPACAIIPAHIWTPWFAMLTKRAGGGTSDHRRRRLPQGERVSTFVRLYSSIHVPHWFGWMRISVGMSLLTETSGFLSLHM